MVRNSFDNEHESAYDGDTLVEKPSRRRTFWTKYQKPIYYILALLLGLAIGFGIYYGYKITKAKGEDTSIKNVVSNADEGVASAWDRVGTNETETGSPTSLRSYSTGVVAPALTGQSASVTKEVESSATASATPEISPPEETSTVVR